MFNGRDMDGSYLIIDLVTKVRAAVANKAAIRGRRPENIRTYFLFGKTGDFWQNSRFLAEWGFKDCLHCQIGGRRRHCVEQRIVCDILIPMATDVFHFEHFEAFSPYTEAGPYQAIDYWKLPEGEPVELVRGRFIVSPSLSTLHQTVISCLIRILQRAEDATDGLMFVSPMDVVLSNDTILQPDLLYISKQRLNIVSDRVEGAPNLVIEILSPESGRRDRTEKLDLYAKHLVDEYWIVDPTCQLFEFLLLEQGRYVVTQPVNNRYQSARLPEVVIDLATFWREVDRRLPRK